MADNTQRAIWDFIKQQYYIDILPNSQPDYKEVMTHNSSFPVFHKMIYEIIHHWATTSDAPLHSFYSIWNVWAGVISSMSHFCALQHWIQISSLHNH
jgi:hypothetical protein